MSAPTLSIDEAIRRISQLGGIYDSESNFSIWDQLEICESLIESTPVDQTDTDGLILNNLKHNPSEMVSVNGSVNGIGKRHENSDEPQKKLQAIKELTQCNYRTSPKVLETLLKEVFSSCVTQDGHWLWIAQHYTPKSINSVIHQMKKAHAEGWITIKNSASYFTEVLKTFHTMRSRFKKKNYDSK